MESNWYGYFPQDVVAEILLRLPVKSVLRLKCVCKYWYALIKSPGFVRKHFNHESNRTRLLLYYTSGFKRADISFLPDETLVGVASSDTVIDYIQCPQIEGGLFFLVGPIDGLFFLHQGTLERSDSMSLWNPSTREFRPIPDPPRIIPPYFYAYYTFGFGLDPLTNDYKVMVIHSLFDIRTAPQFPVRVPYLVLAVYTLGSGTWRYLDPLTLPDPDGCVLGRSSTATCINGTYYWLLSYCNHAKYSILAFDMGCELFSHIEGPEKEGVPFPNVSEGFLTLWNDHIALFLSGLSPTSIAIFVMMEEGCWNKLVTVKPFRESCRPLGFWREEEILFESTLSSKLTSFNLDTHEIRYLGTYGDGKKVFNYKDSLLPLKGRNKDPNRCNFFDPVGDDTTFSVPAARDKALVDKTEELLSRWNVSRMTETCWINRHQLFFDQLNRQKLGD